GERDRVPADKRLGGGQPRVGVDQDGAGGPDEGGGGQPAAQGLLPRAQARAGQQGPAVEQERGGLGRHRLRAGGGDHQGGLIRNRRQDEVAARRADLDPGEGAAELLGGADRAGDRRAELVVAAARAAPAARPGTGLSAGAALVTGAALRGGQGTAPAAVGS